MNSDETEEKINLNKADIDQLCTLPGIGPRVAARIIQQREAMPFSTPEELTSVPGISPAVYARLAHRVTVEDEQAPAERAAETIEQVPAQGAAETVEQPTTTPAAAETARPDKALIPWERETTARPPAPRRDWPGLIGMAAVGALCGALLALLAMAGLNRGSLLLNQRQDVITLQGRADELASRATALESDSASLRARLDALEGLTARMANVEDGLAELATRFEGAETDIADLDARTNALAADVETVRVAAEHFNSFLDGLRDLLLELQGAPSPTTAPGGPFTPTPTPSGTPRPTATPKG